VLIETKVISGFAPIAALKDSRMGLTRDERTD
jgi:hypothetical protein